MDSTQLVTLAGRLAASEISAEEFLRLAAAEVDPSQIATVDLQRAGRCGFPEVIYGSGKSVTAIAQISEQLLANDQRVLVTRLEVEKAAELQKQFPEARYNEVGRTLRIDSAASPAVETIGHVAVITAFTGSACRCDQRERSQTDEPSLGLHDEGNVLPDPGNWLRST